MHPSSVFQRRNCVCVLLLLEGHVFHLKTKVFLKETQRPPVSRHVASRRVTSRGAPHRQVAESDSTSRWRIIQLQT